MTTFGDQLFQLGGVPVGLSGLLFADARLVAPAGNYEPYKHWYRKWKKEKFHTTIPAALAACIGNKNEVIHVALGDHTLNEKLTWSKYNTHLIGASLTPNQPHLDIWQGAAFDPMIEVSARGCIFANMTIRHGTAAADLTAMLISGRYNFFENVYWYTPQVADQDVASYVGVDITGHGNYFRNCHFGAEGTARDQANYNLRIKSRGNVFENCVFTMWADGVAPFFLNLETADDRRYNLFKSCVFYVHWVNNVDQITYALKHTGAGSTSNVIFDSGCVFVGVDYLSSVADSERFWIASPSAAAATAFTLLAKKGLGT